MSDDQKVSLSAIIPEKCVCKCECFLSIHSDIIQILVQYSLGRKSDKVKNIEIKQMFETNQNKVLKHSIRTERVQ